MSLAWGFTYPNWNVSCQVRASVGSNNGSVHVIATWKTRRWIQRWFCAANSTPSGSFPTGRTIAAPVPSLSFYIFQIKSMGSSNYYIAILVDFELKICIQLVDFDGIIFALRDYWGIILLSWWIQRDWECTAPLCLGLENLLVSLVLRSCYLERTITVSLANVNGRWLTLARYLISQPNIEYRTVENMQGRILRKGLFVLSTTAINLDYFPWFFVDGFVQLVQLSGLAHWSMADGCYR